MASTGVSGPESGPFSLHDSAAYSEWRARKLARAPRLAEDLVVDLRDLAAPSPAETAELADRIDRSNMAIYRWTGADDDQERTLDALAAFAPAMGLRDLEQHRSARRQGIVPIEVADMGGRAGFIPYSNRAINWHTDGYYNYHGPERCIRAMALHCVRNAAQGGESGLLDQDIAYIRLRDADPAFVAALMHPEALTIPPHEEEGSPLAHGAVAGPVFVIHPRTGALTMRYTIRKRHVIWRDDPVLHAALAELARVLDSDPLVFRLTLQPGMGVLCNNVLHDRRAFEDSPAGDPGRLLYRIRSFDRALASDRA